MNYAEVTQYVLDGVGRADKLKYVKTSINAVCRNVSGFTTSFEDRVEDVATISLDSLLATLVTPTDLRSIGYIKPANRDIILAPTEPERLFRGGVAEADTYYRLGNEIKVILAQPTDTLIVGYYSYPKVLVADTDTNWLVAKYGTLIGDLVIGRVLRLTGDVQSGVAVENAAMLELQSIMQFIGTEGVSNV